MSETGNDLVSNTMTTKQTTPPLANFQPFPRNSVNLITGPTSIGKTYFVTQLLKHPHLYFQGHINRIIIILCNDRIQHLEFESSFPVAQISIKDFNPEDLEQNDLVVIDDLQAITEIIRLTISVCAHHYNLASLFVITHSLLGNSHFELLNLCHRVFLFMKSRANVRLVKYIISNFYQDPDIQTSLKSIITFCQRQGQVLALELNPLASSEQENLQLIGFSHLTNLHTAGYFLIYIAPQASMDYEEAHTLTTSLDPEHAHHIDLDFEGLPSNALVVVPAITVKQSQLKSKGNETLCSEAEQWNETVDEIEEQINDTFKPNRLKNIKVLTKAILRRKDICLYKDGRFFHKKGRPKTKVNLLDFVGTATRRAMDSDNTSTHEWKLFSMYAKEFTQKGIYKGIIQNKLLLV